MFFMGVRITDTRYIKCVEKRVGYMACGWIK